MSFENDAFFCDIREYVRYESKRIKDPTYLRDTGRCTLMLALNSFSPSRQAGRLDATIEDVTPDENGLTAVTYRVLAGDAPMFEAVHTIQDGYMHNVGDAMLLNGVGIKVGYFLGPEGDEVDSEWFDWDQKDLHRSRVSGTLGTPKV